ncbi:hypothetical protein P3X46_016291 [Hevea brasiliensis]|uniref:WIT1/2 N-terminal helical bundle domain-containing protein n=1 Tax=Hevea brasiliensis TaxID=3981 RepID=A0ABQ9M291_HEVBR|nr:WPP domain-interacting tail-anchored protein 1 [Hevea brasiliensis]XP_021688685.2 WPP domain-interacting tail-anchored protein 1 [Hevea brasiliensis]XP_021688694.2 WPP domain-interacting tail-anchored protein 1 [Hevea brasiliensis]KAJ9173125.1 hypothetical protein P3X46_016291 [Hevea brasiliensis]
MGTDAVAEVGFSLDDVNSADPGAESSKINLVVDMSFNGETISELIIADEIITRMELDLACASEKLVNLSVLMMHVESKESEFETIAPLEGDILGNLVEVMEFDFLSRILYSEVTELDNFVKTFQENIVEAHEMISSYKHLGQTFMAMEEKLLDSEKSLKQLHDQVSEIRMQYTKFQRTLSCLNGEENWSGDEVSNFSEDNQFVDTNAKIKMQTAEQQRHILRMLEKSLAREMDLEKKLTESRQIEEELKHRILSTEQEVFFLEEEAIDVCERWFTAENAAEVLMGISQELLSRLKIFQFNLNGSIKREAELRSNLDKSVEQLEAKENALQKFNNSSVKLSDRLKASLTEAEDKLILANSEVSTLREKVYSVEKQLEESEYQLSTENVNVSMDGPEEQHSALRSEITNLENTVEDLKEELAKVESRAASAEVKCNLLAETNLELNKEMIHLKDASEKVDSLEKQLSESDIRLQHAVASADASQEKQNMLYTTIRDMENLIEDLKLKIQKADSRADNAEDKCIVLSESNAELNEELGFLRGRLECLEISLNQAEETKMIAAKDIGFRTKVITDLVMQLAIERERLHKQMKSLALENKTLVLATNHCNRGSGEKSLFPEHEVTQISASGSKLDKKRKNVSVGETEVADADSILGAESTRRIGAGMLNYKHIIMAVLILLISAAVYLFQPQNHHF